MFEKNLRNDDYISGIQFYNVFFFGNGFNLLQIGYALEIDAQTNVIEINCTRKISKITFFNRFIKNTITTFKCISLGQHIKRYNTYVYQSSETIDVI